MPDPPPVKQSNKSQRLLRPFKGLISRLHNRSPSPTPQGAQSVTPQNASASRSALPTNSATSVPQVNPQGTEYTAIVDHSTTPSISALPKNSATSAPQVNPQGTEYTAILELSTTPSGPLTWEHRLKEWESTAYQGLKMAIQGIYDCSSSFPPLQMTAGVLLTISKVADVRGSMRSTCTYIINVSFRPSESFSE